MPENLLRIALEELKIIRIHCGKAGCAAILELPVEKLSAAHDMVCSACGTSLGNPSALRALGKALDSLKGNADQVRLEFSLAQPPAK